MSLSLFSPLLYLLLGLGIGRSPFEVKGIASAFLTKVVIPFVIIYNIATHKEGVFSIVIGMIVMMSIMLTLSRRMTRDPVENLCFCYLNIAWLGLPIATSLFGDGAAMVIIAAYVGSSLFGNSVGVGLMAHGQSNRSRLFQGLKSPPVWALVVGLFCFSFGQQLVTMVKPAYDVAKFLMGFLGMSILGIWLSETPLKLRDFKSALVKFFIRGGIIFVLVSVFLAFCHTPLLAENKFTLYLLCLLPPAANIIVLETHYMKSGRSAPEIATGTCISIVALAVYVCGVLWLRG